MKALILSGGFGTRLRPLTLTKPKPLVEFADVPILEHQIAALTKAGIPEIILAVSYKPESVVEYMHSLERKYKCKIDFSQENEPLGTAGPIKQAEKLLIQNNPENMFFVLNADIICNFPFEKMIQAHKWHGGEATMCLTTVEDPSKYGVVVTNEEGRAIKFVEKPKTFVSNKINAGIYLLNSSIIKRISLQPTSIEREVFPTLAQDGQLFTLNLDGFWMDIGQPKDYITGLNFYLDYLRETNPEKQNNDENIIGNVITHPSANIDKSALIGPNVSIGEGCTIEAGVRLKNCSVLSNSTIKSNTWISGAIIGWRSQIGRWVRIEGVTVVAEDVQIKDELYINGSCILPHKSLNCSIPDMDTIVM